MKLRYLPFGYQMELGQVIVHLTEANVVRRIFSLYRCGLGYTEITKQLQDQDVAYQPEKPWNKHMVKRILENRRYIGQDGWPVVLDTELFEAVSQRKALAPICRKPAQQADEVTQAPVPHYQPTTAIRRLEQELSRTLERRNAADARALAVQCAVLKYNTLEGGEAVCRP